MQRITLQAEAGQVSAELARRGVSAKARVRATVEIVGPPDVPEASLVLQAGGGFDWLADEPDLHSDEDLPLRP